MESHRYLLDTNIVSALIKQPGGKIYDKLQQIQPLTVCTSIIVAAEIRFGLNKGVSDRLRLQAENVLANMDVLPFETPADHRYGDIRAYLQKAGTPIGHNDLLIAAQCQALNLVLVTHNLSEFSRVPDLCVEDWLVDENNY